MENKELTILVTGGAGFIGSWFVRHALLLGYKIIVLDKLTYSGSLDKLKFRQENQNYIFIKADICDFASNYDILREYRPNYLVNFAAETHVDNSISGPSDFIQTNIVGTYNLLEATRKYLTSSEASKSFKFIHISTDEVYGSLGMNDEAFSEYSPYKPNSPYSASKASSDHLVRSWYSTYNIPTIITHCSNNYGPNQHKEKLIPKVVTNALNDIEIPIYGDGKNIRDWIYVEDHVRGLIKVINKGAAGEKYLFGGNMEISNIDLVHKICDILNRKLGKNFRKNIKFIEDRKGHDYRYAINTEQTDKKLGHRNIFSFDATLESTIDSYIYQDV
ncbi:MAG: dTDP-glucose 4,6-dehydratase [Rickettsiaceae bacterium]|nr:dTDP-glucose 4,6-dehydratase [Rickettsiaceae bacterium]